MIKRRYDEGQLLDVAGLNTIKVVLDRSETRRTEVGFEKFRAGLVGPPHKHEEKEQVYLMMSGSGWVTVDGEKLPVKQGDVIYVPANAVHQTIASPDEDLEYLLFNSFFNDDKEGSATYAEHIEKVKAARKRQAEAANRTK
jgi:quercetin dioxygenase-like cupin family protein